MFLRLHISVCFWLKNEQGLFIQWALLGYSFQCSVCKWVIHRWCFPLLSEVKQGSQSFNYYSSTLIMKFQAVFRKKPGFLLGGLWCVCTTVSQLQFKCLFSWFSEVCDPSFPAKVNPTSKVSLCAIRPHGISTALITNKGSVWQPLENEWVSGSLMKHTVNINLG